MKKSIIVVNYIGRKGISSEAYELSKALSELGENVVPVISKDIDNLELWESFPFEKLIVIDTYNTAVSLAVNTLLLPFRQLKEIKQQCKNYDVSVSFSPMATFWTNQINSCFVNAKRVIINHDPISHSGSSKFIEWYIESSFRKADLVLVHSKVFLPIVEKKYRNTGYIPLGRMNTYKDVYNECPSIYDEKKMNFIFFGRIEDYKGLDILAQAYKIISKKYINQTSLTIAGNGNFSQYVNLYSNCNNVTIINRWINDDEIPRLFSGNNLITVCPYNDSTQSGPILVSYEFGCPVIGTKTGGMIEQIQQGRTGLLIEPRNCEELVGAMEYFILNREKICEMQPYIQSYIEEMSFCNITKSLLQQIKSIK